MTSTFRESFPPGLIELTNLNINRNTISNIAIKDGIAIAIP